MKPILRVVLIVLVILAVGVLLHEAIIYIRQRNQENKIQALQRARDSIIECDDIEFGSWEWPLGAIDDDGLNMKPLSEKRKILLAILDAATTEDCQGNRICVVLIRKGGKRTFYMYLGSDALMFPAFYHYSFKVVGIDVLKILSCQSPPRSEVMDKTMEIIQTCDGVDFSAKDARENFMDDIGLNKEPLDVRRDAVRELLSQCEPRDTIDAALFRGTVHLRKGDAIMLKIALYESGFRIRGYYYEVLNPERNETMLRLLNFHKLKKKSQSP